MELVYPPRRACPFCGGYSPDAGLCSDCRVLVNSYAEEKVCPVCGCFQGMKDPGDGGVVAVPCGECVDGRFFDLARSVGPYEGPLREAVHKLKYRGARWLARPMAQLMAQVAWREQVFTLSGGLVPVPLFPARQKQRGFNQAALLARALGEITGQPVLEGVVARIRETSPQARLSRRERLRNLDGAFAVTGSWQVSGKIITVVDDVLTTGTTVSILSQQLRQAGTRAVLVLTFAGSRQNTRN